MLEININIHAHELAGALAAFANALTAGAQSAANAQDQEITKTQSQTAPVQAVQVQTAPIQAAPVQAPAQIPTVPMQTAPVQAPVQIPTAVPTAAPAYTAEQLARAGAELAQEGRTAQLLELLQQFGAQSVMQVPPGQYGAFATALRGLGAKL